MSIIPEEAPLGDKPEVYALTPWEPPKYRHSIPQSLINALTFYMIESDLDRIREHPNWPVFRSRDEVIGHLHSLHPTPFNSSRVFRATEIISHYALRDVYIVTPEPVAYTEEVALRFIRETPRVRTWPVTNSVRRSLPPNRRGSLKYGFPTVRSTGQAQRKTKNTKVHSQSSIDLDLVRNFLFQCQSLVSKRIDAWTRHRRARVVLIDIPAYRQPARRRSHLIHDAVREPDIFQLLEGARSTSLYLIKNTKSGSNTSMRAENSHAFHHARDAAINIMSIDDAIDLFGPRRGSKQPRRQLLKGNQIGPLVHTLNCTMRCSTADPTAKEMIAALHTLLTRRLRVTGLNPLKEDYPPCQRIPTLRPKPLWHSTRPSWKDRTASLAPTT